jgi:hypothetical protein
MYLARRTPYVNHAQRIIALTEPNDLWIMLWTKEPLNARTVVAIGPKTLLCKGGTEVLEFDSPADIPQAELTPAQHLMLEHYDDLVRGYYAHDLMPYRLAALADAYWGIDARWRAGRTTTEADAALTGEDDWFPLLEPDPTG